MHTEAVLWLGLILASPALFMCSKMLGYWLTGFFVDDNVLELTVENEHGEIVTKRISLDSDDELAKIIDEINSPRNGNEASL